MQYKRWNELFLTDKDTILPGDFVNEAGQSILDMMREDGLSPRDFYKKRMDLDSYLKGKGATLVDFRRKGVTIPQAIERINQEGSLIEGRGLIWTVERLLCFKGNTYSEFFTPTGRVLLDRINRLAGNQGDYRLFATGFTITLVAASALAYSVAAASGNLGNLLTFSNKDKIEASHSASISLVNQHFGASLPKLTDGIAALVGGSSKVDAIASGTGIDLSTVGNQVAGNYFEDVRRVADRLATGMGKPGTDQEVLDALLARFTAGLPVSAETCSTISGSGTFYGVGGFNYSPAVYFGALPEDKAAEAINGIADRWNRGELGENVPDGAKRVFSYQELLNHVKKGSCEVAPITILRPTLRGMGESASFYLVSVISRGSLKMGSANVSQTVFVLADTGVAGILFKSGFKQGAQSPEMQNIFGMPPIGAKANGNLAVRGLACVSCEGGVSAAYASMVPKALSADAACRKMDDKQPLTLEDRAAYWQMFSKVTVKNKEDLGKLANVWSQHGEKDKALTDFGYPAVSLGEFIQHRRKGACEPTGTMIYKLKSDTTPYLISSIRHDGNSVKPVLLMAYDISKYAPNSKNPRGVMQINCEQCAAESGFRSADFDKIKLTLFDIAETMKDEGFGPIEVNQKALLSAIAKHMTARGFVMENDQLNQGIQRLDAAINKVVKEKGGEANFSIEKAIKENPGAVEKALMPNLFGYRHDAGSEPKAIFNAMVDALREHNPALARISNAEVYEMVGESFAANGKNGDDFDAAIESLSTVLAKNEFWK